MSSQIFISCFFSEHSDEEEIRTEYEIWMKIEDVESKGGWFKWSSMMTQWFRSWLNHHLNQLLSEQQCPGILTCTLEESVDPSSEEMRTTLIGERCPICPEIQITEAIMVSNTTSMATSKRNCQTPLEGQSEEWNKKTVSPVVYSPWLGPVLD